VYKNEGTITSNQFTIDESDLETLQYFYITSTRDVCGTDYVSGSTTSDTLGYHVQNLQVTEGGNINYVSYLFDMTSKGIINHADLMKRFNTRPTAFQVWDNSKQDWVVYNYVLGQWLVKYTLAPHEAYLITLGASGSNEKLLTYGKLTEASLNLQENLNIGYILTKKSELSTSNELGDSTEIPGLTNVQYWDVSGQTWKVSNKVFTSWRNTFDIYPGMPVMFNLSAGNSNVW
jgi:hypothetical protein